MSPKNELKYLALAILISVPFTFAAVVAIAFLDENIIAIGQGVASVANIDWSALSVEGAARWPELAGMVIGQILIMVFIYLRIRPAVNDA
jgi:hypothetical protein